MWLGDILFVPTIFILLKEFSNDSSSTENKEEKRTCPNLNDSKSGDMLFHPSTNESYENNSKGPCGANMKLYSVNGIIGECDCEPSPRMLIFNKKESQCFPIFQKGPCRLGKWLDVTREGLPTCKINPCYNNSFIPHGATNKDLVMFNGTCVEIEATSPCQEGFEVGFESGKRLPRCIPKFKMFAIHPPPVKCRPGTYKAISGKCQPEFEFDFD